MLLPTGHPLKLNLSKTTTPLVAVVILECQARPMVEPWDDKPTKASTKEKPV
jgi:hypothetical protein